MRRIVCLSFFLLGGLLALQAWAQDAKIVSVKGDVQVLPSPEATWKKAKVQMLLRNGDQIKTGKKAECVVSFDEAARDVMMVKENTQITIETVVPGTVVLPQGRVFALIKDINTIQKFEVRTPVATAGVRGSGLGVGASKRNADISCFKDKIYAHGLDAAGNVTQEQEITEGFGVDVAEGGSVSQLFALGDDALETWDNFVRAVEAPTSGAAAESGSEGVQDFIEEVTEAEKTIQDTQTETFDNARDDARDESAPEPEPGPY